MNVFETSHLTKKYGKNKVVLDDVNLTVREGDIYGLVGRNGAGKTTLIRILSGLATQTSGEVKINGATTADALAYERRKIGSIIDSPALSSHLTAIENMKSMGYAIGVTNEEKLKDILHKVGLDPNNPTKVKNYSLGMKQRLAIAIALIGDPSILIFGRTRKRTRSHRNFRGKRTFAKIESRRRYHPYLVAFACRTSKTRNLLRHHRRRKTRQGIASKRSRRTLQTLYQSRGGRFENRA